MRRLGCVVAAALALCLAGTGAARGADGATSPAKERAAGASLQLSAEPGFLGLVPGKSSLTDMIRVLGEPNDIARTYFGDPVYYYTGERAPAGAEEVLITTETGGETIYAITIYPLDAPSKADIEAVYGTARLVRGDDLKLLALYPKQKLTVYFSAFGGQVEMLYFGRPRGYPEPDSKQR